jgi:hypothetical protein
VGNFFPGLGLKLMGAVKVLGFRRKDLPAGHAIVGRLFRE